MFDQTRFNRLATHFNISMFGHQTMFDGVWSPNIYRYKHTVIKILTARVPDKTIQSFRELFQQQNEYDVKVIHLVRDPRAVIYSRMKSVPGLGNS